ncbi:hypothetical protein BGY98DRAFT_937530 [Russula aff. rugulosa BPL654]|nr:hypothetical protein BGY98DRAFT_937530 [Russula aff. rugulosa BPL654]
MTFIFSAFQAPSVSSFLTHHWACKVRLSPPRKLMRSGHAQSILRWRGKLDDSKPCVTYKRLDVLTGAPMSLSNCSITVERCKFMIDSECLSLDLGSELELGSAPGVHVCSATNSREGGKQNINLPASQVEVLWKELELEKEKTQIREKGQRSVENKFFKEGTIKEVIGFHKFHAFNGQEESVRLETSNNEKRGKMWTANIKEVELNLYCYKVIYIAALAVGKKMYSITNIVGSSCHYTGLKILAL